MNHGVMLSALMVAVGSTACLPASHYGGTLGAGVTASPTGVHVRAEGYLQPLLYLQVAPGAELTAGAIETSVAARASPIRWGFVGGGVGYRFDVGDDSGGSGFSYHGEVALRIPGVGHGWDALAVGHRPNWYLSLYYRPTRSNGESTHVFGLRIAFTRSWKALDPVVQPVEEP